MARRGRPAVTRARAFHWLEGHYPCTQGTFARTLGLEHSQARRLWRAWMGGKKVDGRDFCPLPEMRIAA